MKTTNRVFVFDSPAVYSIHIMGQVSARWAESLGVMAICTGQESGNPPTTILTGVVSDQAALLGVLTELYEMHCTLLELKRIPEPEASEPAV